MSLTRERLLELFVPHMRSELEANTFKGDAWRCTAPEQLSHDVLYHAAKLDLAVQLGDEDAIREFAADVANCAAILADGLRLIDNPPEPIDPASDEYGSAIGGADLKAEVRDWRRRLADFVPPIPMEPCCRLLVGQGGDTFDPVCTRPKGHEGACAP